MQTFLPYENNKASAEVLDTQRLGKQRVENFQIMQALLGKRLITKAVLRAGLTEDLEMADWVVEDVVRPAWANHPVTLMWRGYEHRLMKYQSDICREWKSRGYKDTTLFKTQYLLMNSKRDEVKTDVPFWIGHRDFHRAHQSNLLRKDREHYAKWFGHVPNDLPYLYPTDDGRLLDKDEFRAYRKARE